MELLKFPKILDIYIENGITSLDIQDNQTMDKIKDIDMKNEFLIVFKKVNDTSNRVVRFFKQYNLYDKFKPIISFLIEANVPFDNLKKQTNEELRTTLKDFDSNNLDKQLIEDFTSTLNLYKFFIEHSLTDKYDNLLHLFFVNNTFTENLLEAIKRNNFEFSLFLELSNLKNFLT